MSHPYYKKPFDFKRIFANNTLEPCDIGISISQHIELIIFTRFGEHRFQPAYGCEVWELDFELIVNQTLWEDKMCQSLARSIIAQEQRLYEVAVAITVKDVEKIFPLKRITEIKKQVDVTVNGKLLATGEHYVFSTALFLSPLSSQ
ncbi:MAG TPA: GPW/gp25 family protein [Chitinophaga sp.]